jgi:ABC-type uncharacterized transport system involved in gliding motility auxiliary subunit
MTGKWIKARQAKFGAYTAMYVLAVVAALGAVNFLANRYTKSWDSTANKQYSLADQTLQLVKGLKSDVSITYFDKTTNFPAGRDLLDRYAALSDKLKVDYIDPDRRPQQAKAAGYQSGSQLLVRSGSRTEEAKALSEEEVTSALARSQKSGKDVACFVTGSGEHGLDDTASDGYSMLKQALERDNVATKSISLLSAATEEGQANPSGKPEVPQDCTVLVSGGPRHQYVQPEVDAIRGYVEGGGHALLLLDPPVGGAHYATEDNATLHTLLASWGVTVNKDLALDVSGIGQILQFGPEIVLVNSYSSHPIVRPTAKLATAFPLARTIEIRNTDKTNVSQLFQSGKASYASTKFGSGSVSFDAAKDRKGPLTLGAAGTYAGSKQGRFVVAGSSLWVSNQFLNFNGNRDLLLNMVSWLEADQSLLSIRPKAASEHPLSMSPQRLQTMFWLSVVLFPMIVLGFGLSAWWKRR